jgi:hypothetical protein
MLTQYSLTWNIFPFIKHIVYWTFVMLYYELCFIPVT